MEKQICCLQLEDGTILDKDVKIGVAYLEAWRTIMVISGSDSFIIVSALLTSVISQEQNDELTAIPSWEEVTCVVKSLSSRKAWRPNSFNGQFLKSSWDIISLDIMRFIQYFFLNELDMEVLNKNYMLPIPKFPWAYTI